MNDPHLKSGIIYRWEPPDLSHIVYIGDITADHTRGLLAESLRHVSGKPYTLALIDVSRLRHLSPESREIGKAHAREGPDGRPPLRGTAIFGASFHIRVIAQFGTMAYSLLKRHTDNPIRFFETEAEARAWLAKRRAELKAHT